MLKPTTLKTKCDVMDCKNLAACYLPAKGKSGKFFLCDSCLHQLAASIDGRRPPKSPKNTIKRKIEEKETENYD